MSCWSIYSALRYLYPPDRQPQCDFSQLLIRVSTNRKAYPFSRYNAQGELSKTDYNSIGGYVYKRKFVKEGHMSMVDSAYAANLAGLKFEL